MAVSIRKTEGQRLKDDRGKRRDEREGVSGRATARERERERRGAGGKKDNIALI